MLIQTMPPELLDQVTELEQATRCDSWTRSIFESCIEANYDFFVLLENQELAGFIISATAVNETHLLNICIKKTYQKQGFGSYLLTDLMQKAKQNESEKIFLEVRESNLAARALYAKMDFIEIGRRKDYYPSDSGREDAFVLALTL